MEFEWDANKNLLNRQKHGIRVEDAIHIFDDENRIEQPDVRNEYGEERWKTIGLVFGIVFSVIFTMRDIAIRIISARRASRKEREEYYNH
jgi:uncharacterized DUF497 family protein